MKIKPSVVQNNNYSIDVTANVINVGANLLINTSAISIGNSTVNSVITVSGITPSGTNYNVTANSITATGPHGNGGSISTPNTINLWKATSTTLNVNAQETAPTGLFFDSSGTRLYVTGSTGDDVNEYLLSSPWNVSTASFVRVSATVGDTAPVDVFFKDDGTRMYILGDTGDAVREFSLSQAWNVATISFVQSFSVATEETAPSGLFFKTDGAKMYVCGTSGDDVNEYNLSQAWNVATSSFLQTFSIAPHATAPQSVFFNSTGSSMWILDSTSDAIIEYSLGTAWNVSTASYVGKRAVTHEESTPTGIWVELSQNKAWVVGQTTADIVQEYQTNATGLLLQSNTITLNGNVQLTDNVAIIANLHVGGVAVIRGAGTIESTATLGGTVTMSTGTGVISIGTSHTTGNTLIGGTTTTGIIQVGRSTANQTVSIANGATTSGNTKVVNIGTDGATGSITNITIGASAAGASGNTVIYGNNVNIPASNVNITGSANVSVAINVGANVNLTTSSIGVGNTTANAVLTSTALTLASGPVANTTGIYPASNTVGVELGGADKRWNLTAQTGAFAGAVSGITTLAAGNTTITGFANVSGNVYVGNSTVFWTANSTEIDVGTTTINSTVVAVGANVVVNTTALYVGNSTVNSVLTATSLDVDGVINVGNTTITGDLIVSGNVFFNGTTTNVNSTNLVVEDKNIVLGDVGTPSDTTADGGGITLKGATDKTLNWVDATDAWTSSEEFNLLTGKSYRINGAVVVNSSSLGTGVTGSSLTSVGTLTGLTVSGAASLQNTLAAGNTTITGFANVSGNVYVGNSTVFWTANSTEMDIGTTTINSTVVAVGANVVANTISLRIGNTTANSLVGNSSINISTATGISGAVTITSGNSTVNSFISIQTQGDGVGAIEIGGTSGGLIDFKSPVTDDYDHRIISNSTGFHIVGGSTTATSNNVNIINANVNIDSGTLFVDSVNNRVGIGNTTPVEKFRVEGDASVLTTLAAGNTSVTGFVNASVSVNSALITVGTSLVGNTTGLYHTGTVNAASYTTTGVTANVTGVYPASNSSGTALGAAANRWILNANTIDASGLATLSGGMNTTTANASVGVNVGANVNLTTTSVGVGNTTVNTVITSTALTIASGVTANTTGVYPTSNSVGVALGSTTQRWNLTANTITASGAISDGAGNVRAVPPVGAAKVTSYTLGTADVGKFVEVGTGGSIIVPDSTFAAGDIVSIFNNTTGNITLTMNITTAYISGADADKATITLATRGVATVLFISGTVCVVSGPIS